LVEAFLCALNNSASVAYTHCLRNCVDHAFKAGVCFEFTAWFTLSVECVFFCSPETLISQSLLLSKQAGAAVGWYGQR